MRAIISIIVPNFNKGAYIEATLKSIIAQTYNNWEVIIVDDGSVDNSYDASLIYAEKYDKIRFTCRNRAPKGGNTCRNIGLSMAKGDYIIFLDSDDLMAPFCLQQRVDYISSKPDLEFAVFPIGTFYNQIGDSSSEWLPKRTRDHLVQFLRHELPWHTSSPIWRKNFLMELNGFDESFQRLQDVELHTRALLQSPKYEIANNVKVDVFYRISDARSRNIYNEEKLNSLYLEAVGKYITKSSSLIYQKKDFKDTNKFQKALFGTYFSALERTLTMGYRLKSIAQNKADEQLRKFTKEMEKDIKIGKWRKRIVCIYVYMFKSNFWRVKGFNRLMKYIFIQLP